MSKFPAVLASALILLLLAFTVAGQEDLAIDRSPLSAEAGMAAAGQVAEITPASQRIAAILPQQATPLATPAAPSTPEPGDRTVALSPQARDVGWWSSGEPRRNHLGDSFLYSGTSDDQVFISALRLDLAQIPRGAPIRSGTLILTGLRAGRLDPAAGGAWTVQILAEDRVPDFVRSDFQALFNAPADITLFPALEPDQLGEGVTNRWALDPAARSWLEQQLVDGAQAAIVRLTGPITGRETLFAWDSGYGPVSAGNTPQLSLVVGPEPATPPPLPSPQLVVVTLTPTPANILTVAADSMAATAIATVIGTFTPTPAGILFATPTPQPENQATLQAIAQQQGLPPIVIPTPTPANLATATADAAQATAVALTTGTFTPVPPDAITPVIVDPTPVPENAATAVAQIEMATVQAARFGTPTPLAYHVLVATPTLTPWVLPPTQAPGNAATAVVRVAEATLAALTTGTPTPLPPNAVTATPIPPLPLVLFLDQMTPTVQPTPTATVPGSVPDQFRGKILFKSDRLGNDQLFLLDPDSGRIGNVTQAWPYELVREAERRAPYGHYEVRVLDDHRRVPQVFFHDSEFDVTRQISLLEGPSYDAVWSPTSDRIAFVSTDPGNDEIYVVSANGEGRQRLTENQWEWDKHPTWSPDGSQIVFYSNRDSGRRQLWIMDADGNNQRLLLDSPYNDWDPVWVK